MANAIRDAINNYVDMNLNAGAALWDTISEFTSSEAKRRKFFYSLILKTFESTDQYCDVRVISNNPSPAQSDNPLLAEVFSRHAAVKILEIHANDINTSAGTLGFLQLLSSLSSLSDKIFYLNDFFEIVNSQAGSISGITLRITKPFVLSDQESGEIVAILPEGAVTVAPEYRPAKHVPLSFDASGLNLLRSLIDQKNKPTTETRS